MKEEREEADKKHPKPDRKIHVTALYTTTAEDKNFVAEPERTLQQVIDEAYRSLGETRRPTDRFFCHAAPRRDLAPYMDTTLRQLSEQGICVRSNGKDKLDFEFDIDAEPGGAAR